MIQADEVLRMLPLKYPEAPPLPVKPTVISVLDYSKGFAHAGRHLLIALSSRPSRLGSVASFRTTRR
jgi:hypothetical protein